MRNDFASITKVRKILNKTNIPQIRSTKSGYIIKCKPLRGYNDLIWPNSSGIKHFDKLTLKQLDRFIELGYFEGDCAWNCAPSQQDFYNFVKNNPKFTFIGYISRYSSVLVNITGITYHGKYTKDQLKAFKNV